MIIGTSIRMSRVLIWASGLCLGWNSPSPASEDKKPPSPALTVEQKQNNLDSFEYVWRTIRDRYWDQKIGGLNWQAIHEEYRPQLEKADSMTKAREVMNSMIMRLGQSHFRIV